MKVIINSQEEKVVVNYNDATKKHYVILQRGSANLLLARYRTENAAIRCKNHVERTLGIV